MLTDPQLQPGEEGPLATTDLIPLWVHRLLSAALVVNPSVRGFILEAIVSGCLPFCSWDTFNVFVTTGDDEASPLPG